MIGDGCSASLELSSWHWPASRSPSPSAAVLRAVLVYIVTLAIVRLGKKRFMGRATAFDVIVGIIIGSVASRAITANASLLPALAAIASIMGLHWLFSAAAIRFPRFGELIKGHRVCW